MRLVLCSYYIEQVADFSVSIFFIIIILFSVKIFVEVL